MKSIATAYCTEIEFAALFTSLIGDLRSWHVCFEGWHALPHKRQGSTTALLVTIFYYFWVKEGHRCEQMDALIVEFRGFIYSCLQSD